MRTNPDTKHTLWRWLAPIPLQILGLMGLLNAGQFLLGSPLGFQPMAGWVLLITLALSIAGAAGLTMRRRWAAASACGAAWWIVAVRLGEAAFGLDSLDDVFLLALVFAILITAIMSRAGL